MDNGRIAFKRELGLWDSTMLVAGSMIGSGIFLVSADVARTLGSPIYFMLAWIVAGFITLVAALSYGELAGMMPQAGGQYVYLREAYNPLIGFLYGWTVFSVIQTGTIAAVAIGFAKYTAIVFPIFSEQNILFELGKWEINATQMLSLAVVFLLTWVNLRGLKGAKLLQMLFTSAKLLALFLVVSVGIYYGFGTKSMHLNLADMWHASQMKEVSKGVWTQETISGWTLWGAFGAAMVGTLFSSDAWNNITYTAGEVINPKRNIPLSLFLGTMIVTIIYLLANVAYLMLLPLQGNPEGQDALARGVMFASNDRVGTAAVEVMLGSSATVFMAILIMVSTFGCSNGMILSGARLYYAMANDGLFFKKAASLNSKGVPAFALYIQAAWIALLCLSGSYSSLLDYVIFVALLFYILTIAGVFVLRKKRPDAERPYQAFGYPYLPILYIVLASAIAIDLMIYKTMMCSLGVGIVLIGIPLYLLQQKNIKD